MKSVAASRTLGALLLPLLLAACGTVQYYPHEARENVHVGKGGSRFVVEGIDVWFNGEPPRKYAIIGYIEDNNSFGIDESHKTIPKHVLAKAKEIGAQGLIESVVAQASNRGSPTIVLGGGTGGFGMGVGFGVPAGNDRVTVKYTALKYLD